MKDIYTQILAGAGGGFACRGLSGGAPPIDRFLAAMSVKRWIHANSGQE